MLKATADAMPQWLLVLGWCLEQGGLGGGGGLGRGRGQGTWAGAERDIRSAKLLKQYCHQYSCTIEENQLERVDP